MSSDHLAWRSTGSTERPISLTPRLSNSGLSSASAPSSVVQTGVKSFGCENSSAQLLPIQSWNLIVPSVVSASKSGATAPIGRAMFRPHVIQVTDEICLLSITGRGHQRNGLRKRTISFFLKGCRWNLLLIGPAAAEKPQRHQKLRCPDIAACAPHPCRTRLRHPRTGTELTATNRQPFKKDATAVSIH